VRAYSGESLDLYKGARRALIQLGDAGVPVALASRTHRPSWALEWLSMLRIDRARTVLDVVEPCPVIFRDGSKASHVREICRRTGVTADRVLFFDDSFADVMDVERLGATAVHCAGGLGMTDARFAEGLRRYAEHPRAALSLAADSHADSRRRRRRRAAPRVEKSVRDQG
jgi:magnesium-dependent phosphatase-1